MTPAGLEPAIPGSVGRCLIHWATGPMISSELRNRIAVHTQGELPGRAGIKPYVQRLLGCVAT